MANHYTIAHIPNSNGVGYAPGATFTQGALFAGLRDGTLPHTPRYNRERLRETARGARNGFVALVAVS